MNSFFHFVSVIDRFLFDDFVDCLYEWFKGVCAIHFRFERQVAHKRNWMSCEKLQFIDKITGFLMFILKLINFESIPSVDLLDSNVMFMCKSIWTDWKLTSSSSMSRPFSTFTYTWLSSHRNCVGLLLRSNSWVLDIGRRYQLVRVMRRVESVHLNIMILQIFNGWRWSSINEIVDLLKPSTASTTLRILNYLVSLKCFCQLERLKWNLTLFRLALGITKKIFTGSFSGRQTNFRSLTKLVRNYVGKEPFGYNIINFTIISIHSGHNTLLFTDSPGRGTLLARSAFISVWGLGSGPNASLAITTLALPLAIYEHLYLLKLFN